jgi:hypothetical protein
MLVHETYLLSPLSPEQPRLWYLSPHLLAQLLQPAAALTFKPQEQVAAGLFVTATATSNATRDTSEFSAPREVR